MATAKRALSVDDLRLGIHNHVRESGMLSTLKTQLRASVLRDMVKADATAVRAAWEEGAGEQSPSDQFADAVVESHLRSRGFNYAHSIFVSEAAVDHPDDSALRAELGIRDAAAGSSPLSILVSRAVPSTFGRRQSVETQTFEGNPEAMSLEQKLALVDTEFAMRATRARDKQRSDYEATLREFQEELREHSRREVQREIAAYKERELAEARKSVEAHYKMLMEQHRVEEAESRRTAEFKLKGEYERIEQRRKDLDAFRAQLALRQEESMKAVSEREQHIVELRQQMDELKQQLQQSKLMLIQQEEIGGGRLQEIEVVRSREQRRIDDLRRMQQEHAQELRLRDEEISDLRFRLRTSSELHERAQRQMSMESQAADQRRELQQRESVQELSNAVQTLRTSFQAGGAPLSRELPPASQLNVEVPQVGAVNAFSSATKVDPPRQQAPAAVAAPLSSSQAMPTTQPRAIVDPLPATTAAMAANIPTSKEAAPQASYSPPPTSAPAITTVNVNAIDDVGTKQAADDKAAEVAAAAKKAEEAAAAAQAEAEAEAKRADIAAAAKKAEDEAAAKKAEEEANRKAAEDAAAAEKRADEAAAAEKRAQEEAAAKKAEEEAVAAKKRAEEEEANRKAAEEAAAKKKADDEAAAEAAKKAAEAEAAKKAEEAEAAKKKAEEAEAAEKAAWLEKKRQEAIEMAQQQQPAPIARTYSSDSFSSSTASSKINVFGGSSSDYDSDW